MVLAKILLLLQETGTSCTELARQEVLRLLYIRERVKGIDMKCTMGEMRTC